MRREFLEFLTHQQTPPKAMAEAIRSEILLSFRGRAIVIKFLIFQFIGGLFSLSMCPQFGLGLVEGHGITHVFRMIGDWACAAFCGSLFLSAGAFLAFVSMKGEELWWVWRRHKFTLAFLPAVLWALLMMANLGFNLKGESPGYHFTWIFAAMMVQALWMQGRSLVFKHLQIHKF